MGNGLNDLIIRGWLWVVYIDFTSGIVLFREEVHYTPIELHYISNLMMNMNDTINYSPPNVPSASLILSGSKPG